VIQSNSSPRLRSSIRCLRILRFNHGARHGPDCRATSVPVSDTRRDAWYCSVFGVLFGLLTWLEACAHVHCGRFALRFHISTNRSTGSLRWRRRSLERRSGGHG
jgi:hypothetical protein